MPPQPTTHTGLSNRWFVHSYSIALTLRAAKPLLLLGLRNFAANPAGFVQANCHRLLAVCHLLPAAAF